MKRLRDRALGGAVNALRDLISERWLGEGWSLRRLHLEPDETGRRIDVDLEGPPEIGPVSLSVYGCHVETQKDGQTLRWSAIEVQRFGVRNEAIEAAIDGIRIGPGQARPEDGIPRALRWVLGR